MKKGKPNAKATFSHETKIAIESEIRSIVEEAGYECVGGAFVRESGELILRVLMDSIGGINMRDCEIVSKKISRMLDEKFDQDISEPYMLEVGSSGKSKPEEGEEV